MTVLYSLQQRNGEETEYEEDEGREGEIERVTDDTIIEYLSDSGFEI